ncbi:hypothetical protein GF377_04095, partial [candidate division GN15 bacterium]|nr:hypothetical protein [candidate division GN15 bacterium]
MNRPGIGILVLVLFVLAAPAAGQNKRLSIDHADYSEIVFSKVEGEPDTLYYGGSVVARSQTSTVYCDTAVIAIGESALLKGRVIIEDEEYRLAADDSVRYDLGTGKARAYGGYFQLFSAEDSLMAVGTNAYFDRDREYFYMLDRPTVYLNYPDTAAMVEVIANIVQYDAATERAEAEGAVRISSSDINSSSDCAILRPKDNALDLFGSPSVIRDRSEISGSFIAMSFGTKAVERVDVVDSAYAEFVEPTDTTEEHFDRSILSGERLVLLFAEGELASAVCRGQAYSWYFPYAEPGADEVQNEVSGDSIHFAINQNALMSVDVVGGAIGSYLTTRRKMEDSVVTEITDTIDYRAQHITYALNDSMITLQSGAETKSGTMQLAAHRVELDTRTKVVEAFAGELPEDTALVDSLFLPELRPSQVPVVLMDAKDTLFGDYLEYSIDTEKGR